MSNLVLKNLQTSLEFINGNDHRLIVEFDTNYYKVGNPDVIIQNADVKITYPLIEHIGIPTSAHTIRVLNLQIDWSTINFQTTNVVVFDKQFNETDGVSKTEEDVIRPSKG